MSISSKKKKKRGKKRKRIFFRGEGRVKAALPALSIDAVNWVALGIFCLLCLVSLTTSQFEFWPLTCQNDLLKRKASSYYSPVERFFLKQHASLFCQFNSSIVKFIILLQYPQIFPMQMPVLKRICRKKNLQCFYSVLSLHLKTFTREERAGKP